MKNGWFLADRLVHQVKPEILINIAIYNLILNFSLEFKMYFHPQNLKNEEITHDLNHDLIFYCSYSPLWLPEDKVSVYSNWDTYMNLVLDQKVSFGRVIALIENSMEKGFNLHHTTPPSQ